MKRQTFKTLSRQKIPRLDWVVSVVFVVVIFGLFVYTILSAGDLLGWTLTQFFNGIR